MVEFIVFIVLVYIITNLQFHDVKPEALFYHDEIDEGTKVDNKGNIWLSYKKILRKYIATTRNLRLRLFLATICLFMTSYMPGSITRFGRTVAHFYSHALLTYLASLLLWIIFPVLPNVSPYFSLAAWAVPVQIIISLLYGAALALFISIFYTVPIVETMQMIIFSAITLLALAADAD